MHIAQMHQSIVLCTPDREYVAIVATWDDLPMEFKIFVYCGTVEITTVVTCALDPKIINLGICENIGIESNRPPMQA